MKLGPLVTGTLLAICFFVGSFFWVGANQIPPQNQRGNQRGVEPDSKERPDLLVTFRGPPPKTGQLIIQLYADEDSFVRRLQPFDECFLKLELSDAVLWEFKDVPAGVYAVVAVHDQNENGHLDVNGVSSPEKIGYSVRQLPRRIQPSFADCCFELTQNKAVELEWQQP